MGILKFRTYCTRVYTDDEIAILKQLAFVHVDPPFQSTVTISDNFFDFSTMYPSSQYTMGKFKSHDQYIT